MTRPFVHLHLHSQYSLLDGAIKIDPLFERAKALNMPAVGLTDHGNLDAKQIATSVQARAQAGRGHRSDRTKHEDAEQARLGLTRFPDPSLRAVSREWTE